MGSLQNPWDPRTLTVGEGVRVGDVLSWGPKSGNREYQIHRTSDPSITCLVVSRELFHSNDFNKHVATTAIEVRHFKASETSLTLLAYPTRNSPVRIGDIPDRKEFVSEHELLQLGKAMLILANASWSDSLYWPHGEICVPLGSQDSKAEQLSLAIRILTGGVDDHNISIEDILEINVELREEFILSFLETLNLHLPCQLDRLSIGQQSDTFSIPGNPMVENLFREKIIDYYSNIEQYQKMSVAPPNGVLLYGPPGSGKTYAVSRLADYLGWPLFEINMGKIGSPYIHETSVLIRKEFAKAASRSPSILFLDEIDSIGMKRDGVQHSHKAEEISELLRQMDSVGKRTVVVIGATNLLENIDEALLRPGRFDFKIDVSFPDFDGVLGVLSNCLSSRPHSPHINLSDIARKLEGRSPAAIESVVNNAARIAVRVQKQEIDTSCLHAALSDLVKNETLS